MTPPLPFIAPAALRAVVGLAIACALSASAIASDGDVNSIIGGAASSSSSTGQTSAPPATPPLPASSRPGVNKTGDGTGIGAAQPEAWIKHANAINHVQLLSGRPLPGSTCRNVIFDARPSLKKRHKMTSGQTVSLDMKELCLVGFRNDSEKRTLVVRLGEQFATLAIVLDPKLFTGYPIAPGQQITVPLRQLPVPALDVSVEVAWEEDLEKASPNVGAATLSLKRDG